MKSWSRKYERKFIYRRIHDSLGTGLRMELRISRGYGKIFSQRDPYFYERANKICAYRIYPRREISEQSVAWILQTSTVNGGLLAINIITEDSINPKNSNLNKIPGRVWEVML